MRKYNFLRLAGVALLCPMFFWGGCSNSTGGQEKISSNPSKSNNTLVVWGMGVEGEKLKEMLPFFKEDHPEMDINIQAIPWAQAHEKLITSVAGDLTPDLCQMGTTWIPEFVSMDSLESLNDYVQHTKELNQENFYPGSWKTGEINGKIYGIPWYVDTRVLFYRTDLLAEVGFPKGPKTWDDLKTACRKLASKDEKGNISRLGISLPAADWMILMKFFWSNSGNILSEDNRSVIINSPENLEALDFYTSFFKEDLSVRSAKGGVEMYNAFREGYIPMFFGGSWMLDDLNKHVPEIKGKWNVCIIPVKKTGTSFVGGSNWSIFKKSDKKDLAWKFIEFMSKPDSQIKWYQLTKDLPSNIEAWNSGFFDDKPMVKVFGEQLADTQSPPRIQKWEEISNRINLRMEEAVFGKSSNRNALLAMEKDIKEIIDQGK